MRSRPVSDSAQGARLAELGIDHERAYLASLAADGRTVTEIDTKAGPQAAAEATKAAMIRGDRVIYQATFFDGTWLGYADFLIRNDEPRDAGRWAWHYEVEDTKLARHTDPSFLLQLAFYSECVAHVQGVAPRGMYVVLGDGTRTRFAVDDYVAYFRTVKQRFLDFIERGHATTYPEPVAHCAMCAWNDRCTERREADDHLSLVASISRLQTGRLTDAGIATLHALGESGDADRPPKMEKATFAKLRRQARLQDQQRLAIERGDPNPYRFEFVDDGDDASGRGLFLIPEPSPGDVFFDMEGDPYYEMGTGLEYLFGATTPDRPYFRAFWGCDRTGVTSQDRRAEKLAFEAFVDFVTERRAIFPSMHVYHYASYEKTALLNLSVRHATREEAVDDLVTAGVLVDLYRVVRQALVVGQPSYSIKKIEEFYGKRGDGSNVKAGDASILEFEKWLALRSDPQRRDDGILDDLEAYNRYDCDSTLGLRDWLLGLRTQAERALQRPIPYFSPPSKAGVEGKKPAKEDKYAALLVDLADAIPPEFDPEDARFTAFRPLWLAQHLLEYHWREQKPVSWQFHDRCDAYADDRDAMVANPDSIVGIASTGPPVLVKKSMHHSFRYPAQFHKLERGDDCFDLSTKHPAGKVVEVEDGDPFGVIILVRGPKLLLVPLPEAITQRKTVGADAIRDALARFSAALLAGDTARYRAANDVLNAATPRFERRGNGEVLQPPVVDESALRDLCDDLDESYLFVQGPPGSGKTYLGARLIVGLIASGKRVGVTANSHQAIHNLLDEIERVAAERGVTFRGVKKCTADDDATHYRGASFENDDKTLAHAEARLVAGTPWAFGPSAMDASLDVLVIDEAGQMPLANALASMTAARNVVLLGDPLQLPHVRHARHPGDIGNSVLEYLLGDELRPVAPERGVLLTDSFRMHPDVCTFISKLSYEGKLHAASDREKQRVTSAGYSGTGLRVLPVEHRDNTQRSTEEARAIADAVDTLLAGSVTDFHGVTRAMRPYDIIVVAPYNAQVRCIRTELDKKAARRTIRVGTVDKFQGREAYVVFFSTAASSPEDAPRGMAFVFDLQRFNVAISRARALAILVTSPALLVRRCTSIEDMRVANGVARFVEDATP